MRMTVFDKTKLCGLEKNILLRGGKPRIVDRDFAWRDGRAIETEDLGACRVRYRAQRWKGKEAAFFVSIWKHQGFMNI
jgi:hypothetical protein